MGLIIYKHLTFDSFDILTIKDFSSTAIQNTFTDFTQSVSSHFSESDSVKKLTNTVLELDITALETKLTTYSHFAE